MVSGFSIFGVVAGISGVMVFGIMSSEGVGSMLNVGDDITTTCVSIQSIYVLHFKAAPHLYVL